MTRRSRMVLATLAILLLLPASATAAAEWRGQLSTQGLTTEGRTVTEGHLAAFFRYDALDTAGLTPAQFKLTAELARVETQQGDPVIVGTPGAANVPVMQTSNTNEYRSATFTGTENRPTYQFEVMALPGHSPPVMYSVSSCAKAEPSDRDDAVSEPLVNFSRDFSVSVPRAVLWHDCSMASQLSIEGSFMVILWEWDCQLEVDGHVTLLKSGYDQSESAAGSTLYPAVATSRQQYVFVENGRLEVSAMDATPHMAFLEAGAISSGNASFVGTIGQLSNGHVDRDLTASALTLRGDMTFSFAPQASTERLELGLAGTVDSGEADGQPLSFASPSPAGQGVSPWLFGLIGAVLVPPAFIPLGRRAVRRRHLATVSAQAQELLNLNRCDEAGPLVEELAQLAPRDPRVRHQKALMLECRGDYRGAVELRRALDAALQAERVASPALLAENRFQLALLGGRLHRRTVGLERTQWGHTALLYLREAVTVNPSLADYVPLHPELAGLHPDLRTTPADQLFTN